MARVLLSCHYHQSSLCTSSLMKHVDICYFNFHINAALIPWALSLWLRESAHIFLWMWTKPGDQNHKISCGCGKHRWKSEEGLKSRQINSFTRKGRHHISDWCKVLQAPQIRTTITCCGNAKQMQPWFGKSRLALQNERTVTLQLETVEPLRNGISTGVQLIGAFEYWNQKFKISIANSLCQHSTSTQRSPQNLILGRMESLWKRHKLSTATGIVLYISVY